MGAKANDKIKALEKADEVRAGCRASWGGTCGLLGLPWVTWVSFCFCPFLVVLGCPWHRLQSKLP